MDGFYAFTKQLSCSFLRIVEMDSNDDVEYIYIYIGVIEFVFIVIQTKF